MDPVPAGHQNSPSLTLLCPAIDPAHYSIERTSTCTMAFEPPTLESGGTEKVGVSLLAES